MYKIQGKIALEKIIYEWEPELAEYVYAAIDFDYTGHDIYHCIRVKQLAAYIAKKENFDQEVMIATAYLHDIGRKSEKNGLGDHASIGAVVAPDILNKINFPHKKINMVIKCIQHHEDTVELISKKRDLPTEVLGFQDADKLDATGAIGIARTFAYGGSHGIPIWIPEIPAGEWVRGKLSASAFNHILERTIKIVDMMNTSTGRRLAITRHNFVEQFLREFNIEWHEEE